MAPIVPRGARPRPSLPLLPKVSLTQPTHDDVVLDISSSSCHSLAVSSSSDSASSVTASSYTSSWTCHSACSSQSSFSEGSSSTSAVAKRPARPLPKVPSVASLDACASGSWSTHTSASPSAYTFPRPLPSPPQGSLLPEHTRTHPSSTACIRPLPVPRISEPEATEPVSQNLCPGNVTMSYLRVDVASSSLEGFSLESPASPATPLIFSTGGCSTSTLSEAPSGAETMAKTMGYIEIDPPPDDASVEPRDDDSTDTESETVCFSKDVSVDHHTVLRPAHAQRNVHITVELVPSKNYSQRGSRVWIRERKGRRWVEDDYGEILRELRRL